MRRLDSGSVVRHDAAAEKAENCLATPTELTRKSYRLSMRLRIR